MVCHWGYKCDSTRNNKVGKDAFCLATLRTDRILTVLIRAMQRHSPEHHLLHVDLHLQPLCILCLYMKLLDTLRTDRRQGPCTC